MNDEASWVEGLGDGRTGVHSSVERLNRPRTCFKKSTGPKIRLLKLVVVNLCYTVLRTGDLVSDRNDHITAPQSRKLSDAIFIKAF